MTTSKPFSTISYNSINFLVDRLNDFYNRHIIDFYAFVNHHAEEDEHKPHIHLFIVPSRKLDTSSIIDSLIELDNNNPDKPFRCIRPVSSKFSDWYLYSLHDTAYLASKGQDRKFHYSRDDFYTSDSDYFLELIHSIDLSKLRRHQMLVEKAQRGVPFDQLCFDGLIPVQLVTQYARIYENIGHNLYRNGKPNHEEDA